MRSKSAKISSKRFAPFGPMLGERAAHVARCDARQNGVTLGSTEVGRNPLHERVPVAPEFGRVQPAFTYAPLCSLSRTF